MRTLLHLLSGRWASVFLAVAALCGAAPALQAQQQTTVYVDTGAARLFSDSAKTQPLSGGTSVDGNGCVVELGYHSSATSSNKFAGDWVPLTGPNAKNTGLKVTTVGDLSAEGAGDGSLALSLTFQAGSAASGQDLPAAGVPLVLRFYNATSLSTATRYNAVSNALWAWALPQSAPSNPVVAVSLEDAGLEWLGGANSAFYTSQSTAVPVSITWAKPSDITYGTTIGSAQLNATAPAGVAGSFAYSVSSGTVLGVGSQTITATFTPADAVKYEVSTAQVTFNVQPATLTVKANDKARLYGAADSVFDGVIAGFVNSESASSIGLVVSYLAQVSNTSPAGTYVIAASGPQSKGNYNISYANGTLTVGKAPLTVKANDKSRAPSVANPTFDATYSGLVNGDLFNQILLTVSFDTIAASTSASGTYPITVSGPSSTAKYQVTYLPGTLTVTSKTVPAITWADPAAIGYGTALSSAQLNASANVPGTFTYSPGANAILSAGTQTLQATFTPADQIAYSTATKTVALVVNKASLAVKANNASRIEGQSNPSFAATSTGFVNGDSVVSTGLQLSFSTEASERSAAGTYPITAAGPNSLANYNVTYQAGALTVTAKIVPEIAWGAGSITYGTALGANQLSASATVRSGSGGSAGISTSNRVEGVYVYNPPAGTILPAGTKDLSVTFMPNDSVTYASVTAKATLSVAKAPLVVKANDKTRGTDLENPALDATVSGLVNGDTQESIALRFEFSTQAVPGSSAGTYPIVVSGPQATDNYGITYTSGTLTVSGKTLPVIAWGDSSGNLSEIISGTALGAAQLNATAAAPNSTTSLPGVFTYEPALGVVPPTGLQTLKATFTPTDSTTYATVSKTVKINVLAKLAPVISWSAPLEITYGTALSSAQLNAVLSAPAGSQIVPPGKLTYSPAAGVVPRAGTTILSVTFTPDDANTYASATSTVQLNVARKNLTITPNDKIRAVGSDNPAFDVKVEGLVVGDSIPAGAIAFRCDAVATSAAGAYPITVVPPQTLPSDYNVTFGTGTLTVSGKVVPVISWGNPADISYGTALSAAQLNAVAFLSSTSAGTAVNTGSVPGTYSYTPALGTLLSAGTSTLTVNFTPADATKYEPASKTVSLNVTKKALFVKANEKTRAVGVANPDLDARYDGLVNGDTSSSIGLTLSLTTTANTDSPAGLYPIVAAGAASTANYTVNYFPGTLTVSSKAVPIITWTTPAAITYGTPLSGTQLNATASVAGQTSGTTAVQGNFAYSPREGSVLGAGTQTLQVTFTPNDASYSSVTKTVTLLVNKAPLTVKANDKSRSAGGVDPVFDSTYTGLVNGDSFDKIGLPVTYAVTTSSSANGTTYAIIPSGAGSTANYTVSYQPGVLIQKDKITPAIAWSNPAEILYGTALSSAQLNAVVSGIPGTFTYTPASGTVLASGAAQTLSVTFTPADTATYAVPEPKTVTLTVAKRPLVVKANDKSRKTDTENPAFDATYSGLVNNDSVTSIGLSVQYATSAVTSSAAGVYQITPSGASTTTNYSVTYQPGLLTVTSKILPVITWATPAAITYGTAVSAAQLNASVAGLQPGTFNYMIGNGLKASGAILPAGTYDVLVTFVPSTADLATYSTATARVQLTVNKAALTVKANDKTRTVGGADPVFDASYTGFVNGDSAASVGLGASFTTSATSADGPNTYTITPTGPSSLANYLVSYLSGSLTVAAKTAPVVAWSPPADIVYGTPLGSQQLSATSTVPGSFTYNPAAGTILGAGSRTLSVTFTPADAATYSPVTVEKPLVVTKKAITITAVNKAKVQGSENPVFEATFSGLSTTDSTANVVSQLTYQTTATTASAAGTYPITPGGLGTQDNYSITYVPGTLTVTSKSLPTIVWAAPADITYGTTLGTAQLNATAIDASTKKAVTGTFTYNPASGALLSAGNAQTLSVTFTPATATAATYASVTQTVPINVLRRAVTITADAKVRNYGSANPTFTATSAGFFNTDSVESLKLGVSYSVGGSATNSGAVAGSTGFATETSPAGTYLIIPSGPASVGNYDIRYIAGFLTVKPVDLTITAEAKSRVYGAANPVFTVGAPAGLVAGDDLSKLSGSLVFTTTATAASAAGAYPVTPSGLISNNYNIKFVAANLTVTKALLVVKANDKTRGQGQANPAFDAVYSGLVGADSAASIGLTVAYATPAATTSAAGSYPITPSGKTDLPNYTVSYVPGLLTVVETTKTVPAITWVPTGATTAKAAEITYGTALSSAQLNAALPSGTSDKGGLVYNPPLGTVLPAGNSQTLQVSFIPNESAAATYAPTTKTVTINVLKKALTVTAGNKTRLVGESNPVFEASYNGLVNGDRSDSSGLAVAFACAATASSPAGDYAITASGISNPNYSVTYVPGKLTVAGKTEAAIAWATPADITYGMALSATQLNATKPANGSFEYSPAVGTVLSAGVQALTVTFTPDDLTANAVVTKTVKLNVLRKGLTVTANNQSRAFGQPNASFSAEYVGFVGSDDASKLGGALTFTCLATAASPGGAYPIKPGGLTSNDYAINFAEGTLTVEDAGLVSFSTATYSAAKTVSGGAVQLVLRRTRGSLGSATATLTVTGGTASSSDYGLSGTQVTWANGDKADKTVTLTVSSSLSASKTVAFQLDPGAAAAGDNATANVFLVVEAVSKPTVTLLTPTAGAKLTGTNVLFKGAATDNAGVDRVEVTLNGETYEAELSGTSNTSKNWQLTLVPQQGANSVIVTAYDTQGTATALPARSFTFSYLRPLLAGTYDGLLVPGAEATKPSEQYGLFNATVTTTGLLTGKLSVAGTTVPFTGMLNVDLSTGVVFGTAFNSPTTKDITKDNKGAVKLGVLTLRMDDSGDYPVLVGEYAAPDDSGAVYSTLSANKAVYTAAKVIPEGMLAVPASVYDPAGEKGVYTTLFLTSDSSSYLDRTRFPLGAGSSTLTVTTAGVATFVGKLADGTVLSYSNRLSANNQMPIYVPLYNGKGLIAGIVSFDDAQIDSDARCDGMAWFRPVTTPVTAATIYKDGWPDGISMDLRASKYVAPTKATKTVPNPLNPNTVLGAEVVGVTAPSMNIQIGLADGGIADPTLNNAALTAANLVTVLSAPAGSASANALKLTFTATTGLFTGSFTHPLSKKSLTLSGAVFQKTQQAGGCFQYTPLPAAVTADPTGLLSPETSTPQVGSVTVSSIAGQ